MDEVSNNEAATANAPETNAPEVTPPSTTSATSAPQAATSEAPATEIAAPESDAPESDAPETTSAEAAPQAEITAGELLKAMRERAGVQLETIAATLKVSTQKLKALEANDFSSMPAVYFTRALAASVCRQLGQDPAPVLEKIPRRQAFCQSIWQQQQCRPARTAYSTAHRVRHDIYRHAQQHFCQSALVASCYCTYACRSSGIVLHSLSKRPLECRRARTRAAGKQHHL